MLRPDGDREIRSRAEAALRSGDACWCPIVQLELWNVAGGARAQGVTVPAADVAIAACARRHGASLESADSDLELLAGVLAINQD